MERRSFFPSHNFSDIEDNAEAFSIIRQLAEYAGKNAAAEAKAAGLTRIYIRNNNKLVKVMADGEEVPVSPLIKKAAFYIKYKPSTKLHAVKK